jgi:flagellin
MSYIINTNVASLNAQVNANRTSTEQQTALQRLSSGLRINSAADNASGLAIADSLKSQASSLGQAINNANNGVSIIQTADGAMAEQTNILNTIKTQATQAAQDGQTTQSRQAIQANIANLMNELNNIASTTSFNGQSLLSGAFTNKSFQVGAYANQTITASIGNTSSSVIGNTRFETSANITASGVTTLKFTQGSSTYTLGSVTISTSAGTGLGALATAINANSNKLNGLQASYQVVDTGSASVTTGTITDLTINGINLGSVTVANAGDSHGVLVGAINNASTTTGVTAALDSRGNLVLTSADGRGIQISGTGLGSVTHLNNTSDSYTNYGRLTLTRAGAGDIIVSAGGMSVLDKAMNGGSASKTVNLGSVLGSISADNASAMGFNANLNVENITQKQGAGVTTLHGAMAVMSIADAALTDLNKIRSGLGAAQNQFTATINNISVTQVNVTSAESQIRDVNFASESATFSKLNILAQSGAYALAQANTTQQNVLRLLQ